MKIKRIFASLLAVMLLLAAMPSAAFAAEADDESPDMTPHTITFEVPAGEAGEYDIMPIIWGQFCPAMVSNYTYYTKYFYIDGPYFAYEVTAKVNGGGYVNDYFRVDLLMGEATKAGMNVVANGAVYKNDWISISSGDDYRFAVRNTTSYDLSVDITYYSW